MRIEYQNPVWSGYMADPFVLKCQAEYFAYGTTNQLLGSQSDRAFQILKSTDLAVWESIGGALGVESGSNAAYWAPEVAEHNGRFYMYYSMAPSGSDEAHRIHVAVAESPAGPFRTMVRRLIPNEDFTIDAHPFRDPADGQWYLFFAKDYFDSRVGTAVAVVRLSENMLEVAGSAVTVLRASSDWQIFERNRSIYGRRWDAWHTVEGPTVAFHNGLYYLFYSGGNWTTAGYGVGYAVAKSVLGPYSEPEIGPVVLSTVADAVLGPGHNCVATAPDGGADFIVYHAWDLDRTARRMCIDPLAWTNLGPRCIGPTNDRRSVAG